MAEKSAPPVSVTCAAVTETGDSLGIQKVNHVRCNQVQHKMSGGMIAVQKSSACLNEKRKSDEICDLLTAGVVEVNFLRTYPEVWPCSYVKFTGVIINLIFTSSYTI